MVKSHGIAKKIIADFRDHFVNYLVAALVAGIFGGIGWVARGSSNYTTLPGRVVALEVNSEEDIKFQRDVNNSLLMIQSQQAEDSGRISRLEESSKETNNKLDELNKKLDEFILKFIK